jgi:hypothetical protein
LGSPMSSGVHGTYSRSRWVRVFSNRVCKVTGPTVWARSPRGRLVYLTRSALPRKTWLVLKNLVPGPDLRERDHKEEITRGRGRDVLSNAAFTHSTGPTQSL